MSFQFENLNTFFSMGGHGVYVWLSYGLSVLILAWLVASPVKRRKKTLLTLKRHHQQHHSGGEEKTS